MGQFYVAVYAICRNEAQFARRWMASMGEADLVCVLDTGSEDATPDLLRQLGAVVQEEPILPWRFDDARNRSLQLVPEDVDICVCTDLDEVFSPGWRRALERIWAEGADQVTYPYVWSFLPDGREGLTFWTNKIHARQGFRWIYPVHEVLERTGRPARILPAPELRLEHHPDPAKSRSEYLPLLELARRENPTDPRCIHYLGREYLFRGRWQDAIDTFRQYLLLPTARWEEERCAAMGYLARCYEALGETGEQERWLYRACGEAPWLREPWMDLGWYHYGREHWHGVISACRRALEISEPSQSYLNAASSWDETPYDLLAIALYRTGDLYHALAEEEEALKRAPGNGRLRENLSFLRRRAAGTE